MKCLVFLVCFFSGLLPKAMAQVEHEPIWVAKKVIFGVSPKGIPAGIVAPQDLADVDQDGYPELFMTILESSGERNSFWGLLLGKGFRMKSLERVPGFSKKLEGLNQKMLQRSDHLEIIAGSGDPKIPLPRWVFPGLGFLGRVFLPQAPPPYHLDGFFGTSIWVGDLEGDGFDEILGWTGGWRGDVFPRVWIWAYTLLDGRTLTVRWQFILQNGLTGVVEQERNSGPVGDVDGDGVDDILLDLLQRDPLRVSKSLVSGADGHVLWNKGGFPQPVFASFPENQILPDLDGDGIGDVLVYSKPLWSYAAPGYMTVLSGRTGQPFWKHAVGPGFPSFGNTHARHGALPVWAKGTAGDVDEDGVPDLLFETQEWTDPSAVFPVQWVYSGRTGELLAREGWVDSFEPWLPNDIPFHDAFKGTFRLGDLDQDGWPDVGVRYLSANNFSHFVIAGRRTLWTKPKARPGDVLEAHLWIPNGAGRTWRLFGSTGFRNDGSSLHAGVWDTHLAQEDLLHNTNGGLVLLSGSLDAAGKADFQLSVPPDPQLSGQTLYFTAVVDDPAQPDGVLTLSTLAQVHVRP